MTPSAPKASVQSVLATYDLAPGDEVVAVGFPFGIGCDREALFLFDADSTEEILLLAAGLRTARVGADLSVLKVTEEPLPEKLTWTLPALSEASAHSV